MRGTQVDNSLDSKMIQGCEYQTIIFVFHGLLESIHEKLMEILKRIGIPDKERRIIVHL